MEFIEYKHPTATLNGDSDWLMFQTEGQILRTRREELKLTQQQVANKAKILLRQYQRLESGERNLTSASARIMLSVCAVLKLDPYFFFPSLTM